MMRKILSVLMAAVMLLGLLAGCDVAGNTETTAAATEGTSPVANPIASGMLVLNANAAINVSYDSEGLVLDLEGIDNNGKELVTEYQDFLGESCSTVICKLIKDSSAVGYLAEGHYVMIKQAIGSQLPGTNFLEELTTDAKAALEAVNTSALLLVLGEEDLDENGYINLESAKELTLAYLNLETFDTFDGTSAPVNGIYGFKVIAGIIDEDLLVDAVTGAVYSGTIDTGEEDAEHNSEDEVGTEPTDNEEDVVVTVPTEPATQPENPEETTAEEA